jgi:hypothetical protein
MARVYTIQLDEQDPVTDLIELRLNHDIRKVMFNTGESFNVVFHEGSVFIKPKGARKLILPLPLKTQFPTHAYCVYSRNR